MKGLRGCARRHGRRREPRLHASGEPRHEVEDLGRSATVGLHAFVDAGGRSTAFSGDRAWSARRKAVDGPEASQGGAPGAAAPDARQPCPGYAWQALAKVWGRVVAAMAWRRYAAYRTSRRGAGGNSQKRTLGR
jgi:hypothetical protein